ncbi:putative protein fmtA [Glarea lozoyensis 74030]|uniref:Beta-lactamase/transpeptidase-like protein n=1 Tax=Glarea lozoyensis (strain ATCC 74030 / MF5533) TaxID=1104152 RepID=H0EIY1_GLAL7|nr:putative protein fmtA [Glarea lozoyensis 74030]
MKSLSIGVLLHGEVIYTGHHGRKDITKSEPPNDDTLYHIASLTKLLTAAAIGVLIDEGKLHWETRIRDVLPEFKLRKDIVGQEATLIDVLSNRTGMTLGNAFWGLRSGEFLLPKDQVVPTSCDIQAVRPFRKRFLYTNWNYALATAIIEKVTGKTFGEFVKERLLDPLDLRRTTLGDPGTDNVAMAHAIYDNGTACKIPFPNLSDETGMAGGAAGKSSIRDLLIMYKSLLSAYKHQLKSGLTSTPGSPFKQLKTVFAPHIGINDQQSYCLGLYKTTLPGNIGIASLNHAFLGPKNKPFSGALNPGIEVFHHTGNLPGTTASMFLLPATQTAIVVLTNSLPLSDPTDFTGRLILSALLNETRPTNFPDLSKMVRQNQLLAYAKLISQLEKGKTGVPPPFPLSAYAGVYFNNLGNYNVQIIPQGSGLLMIVQNKPHTRFALLPYDGNTFYWPANRERELCVDHGFPVLSAGFHKIVFTSNTDDVVDRLIWDCDPGAKPSIFEKNWNGSMARDVKL